jgi:hypothetical protein
MNAQRSRKISHGFAQVYADRIQIRLIRVYPRLNILWPGNITGRDARAPYFLLNWRL